MSELCSLCQAVEAGPYCPEHGVVHRRFSIGERYEVEELLGSAMASFVFGARDCTAGHSVAIKVLREHLTRTQVAEIREVQARFLRDNAAAGQRGREQAVGIVDFGWDDALGVTYLVACRIGNPSLRPSVEEVEGTLAPIDESAKAPSAADSSEVEMPAMIGSYDVIGRLGTGGTGRVYLGQHPVIGSKVAIKVLLPEIARSPETVDRFIQEARASSQIGSPHIPRYFDFGTTPDGLPYAIMEYFEGETLGVRLGRVGTMSVAETAQIVQQVASALLMAHEAGLIHRDLKPDNIFLVAPDSKTSKSMTTRGAGSSSDLTAPAIVVKVLDFGIAKVVGNRSPNRTLTGSFLGTPYYCAPEQVFGHPVDARTDVYSLGVTAFEMLSGAPPFVGQVPIILSSKATEEPPELEGAGVPTRVARTIRRMLAREPRHRAPSMAWVLEQVASWQVSDEAAVAPNRSPSDELSAEEWERTDSLPTEAMPAVSTGALAAATTSQAMRTLAPPRSRARAWIAVAVTGGVLVAAAAVVLLGSSSRGAASTSSPPGPRAPSAGSAVGPAVLPGASVEPRPGPSASGGASADAPTAAAPSSPGDDVQGATAPGTAAQTAPASAAPGEPPGSGAEPPESSEADKAAHEPPATGRPPVRRPSKPSDKRPPRKPPGKPPTSPDDVLIVDPFSSTRGDPR